MDLNTTPVMPPPPGEVTNFHVGMTEVQHKFIIVYAGTLAGATITLGLRLWARAGILKQLWWDDYIVIGAWLMNIGFLICCVEWMKYGFGDHLWNVSLAQLAQYAQWATPVVTTYCWGPMLTKFSILVLYLRLNPTKIFRYTIFFLMFMIFSYTIATTVIVAAGCKPTDPSKTQCINNLALAQAILNIVSDIFVIIIPLPMIHMLQMPKGQKVALAILLTTGSFVAVASIIRLVIIQNLPGQVDTTWVEAEVCVWSAIELNVGLMCNCLVVTKPLIQRYAGTWLSSFTGSKPSGYKLSNHQSNVPKVWRGAGENDSVPLTDINVPKQGSKADIIITTTYRIDEEAGTGRSTAGGSVADKEADSSWSAMSTKNNSFRSESQEELAKK